MGRLSSDDGSRPNSSNKHIQHNIKGKIFAYSRYKSYLCVQLIINKVKE